MKNTVTAVDIGTSKIVAVVGELGDDLNSELIGYGVAPYDGYTGQVWNQSEREVCDAIKAALRAAYEMTGREADGVYVGVPSVCVSVLPCQGTIAVASGKVTAADMKAAFDKAAAVTAGTSILLHRCIGWFKAGDSISMEPEGLACTELTCAVYAIVADKQYTDRLSRLFESAGVSVKGFLCAQLGETLLAVPPAERDKTAVLIDCGYLVTQVMVTRGDAICHIGTIGDGAGFWTALIAQELGVSFQLAEQIKRRTVLAMSDNASAAIELFDEKGETVTYERERVALILSKPLSELADAIKANLDAAGFGLNAKTPYYLTGGGLAPMGGARQFLSGRLGVPVRACVIKPTKLMGANYTSSVGLLELVFEQICQEAFSTKGDLFTKLKSIFKK